MSGIAPRRSAAAFDPLMNPGDAPADDDESTTPTELDSDAPKSSLALSKQVDVASVLKSLSFGAAGGDDEDDVPVTSMAEFLGEAPGGSLFAEQTKAKTSKLFADSDSDEEDEATRERKAKRRAAAAAAAAAAAEAAAAEQLQVSAPVTPAAEVEVAPTRAAHRQPRAAGATDLFEEDDAATTADRALGLQGVFVPNGALEHHTAETMYKGEEIDSRLLEQPDEDELDQLVNKKKHPTLAAAAAASATAASANFADDFQFSGSSSAVAAAADDDSFDFSKYIASQSGATAAASTTTGGRSSLFDDDDD